MSDEMDETPCEADWAETAIDADAIVPDYETLNGGTAEMMIGQDDDGDDLELFCGCEQCECGVVLFYEEYLTFIKRLSATEIDNMTTSYRHSMRCGYRIIQGFIDTLWSTGTTATVDGDHILDAWKVADESRFCHSQLYIWKNQMVARKLIGG
jgi:hypothetical protein